ncbi:aminoglycoside phosphotransferase family protein [Anaerotignum sp. MSJ-24]|uniref:aminoglycoside phosphotransferase family protein n=1 Tax=Anaerotignum sp. MSJ-24 TaxID=2841521 RepID=UPI001C0F8086|nr:aminoglycoside phosphotransferase family protein [Anaerotignum sp. MSJ-24]MBU5464512.1 aminoglycoside phosphotransferase family protein [Anaerotignum sp. MSJ-24]
MQKKCRLLIPSAKIVPQELQKLGKLPAVIYPINQRITFDYIYEKYGEDCAGIDVICYENADKIERRLKKLIDSNALQLIKLPELRDLGYTIWFALQNRVDPIIINFADTIVLDSISKIEGDAFFCQEDYMTDTWTYFDEKEGMITNIYDKDCANEEMKKKLFVGIFKIMDVVEFKKCLEAAFENTNSSISSFYYALQLYSKSHPMTPVLTENWFDIGHADRYYNSKLEVKAREFNHITVDKNRGILRKTSDDKDKFIGEIKWYLKLPADVEYVRPRIFNYSTSYVNPYVSMEYYAYHTVHELFLYGDLTLQQWIDIFNRIRFVCDDFKRYTVQDANIRPALEEMYLTKTLQRFEKMKKDERFITFFESPIVVNGERYLPLNEIIITLEKAIPEMLYDVDTFNIIHGDLCFANIMVDSNFSFIKVIDPRGKFGTYDIYGDFRYELAKLFHSVDGKYDFIIKDLFDLDYNSETACINYRIQNRKRDFNLYKVFLDTFSAEVGGDLKKIELIEALLFLSMIPLHGESIRHQMAMLGTGLEILNRVIDIKESV